MVKLTKKIRIDGYDILKNEFKISFQLAGFADHLKFVSIYSHPGHYSFDGDDEQQLLMLGFSSGDVDQIVEEIFNWVEKPRKRLDDHCHGYTMRTRFEATKTTERFEKECRGKVEVERIIAAAPPLDWAMSALDELEGDADATNLEELWHEWTASLDHDSPAVKATQLGIQTVLDRVADMESFGLVEPPEAAKTSASDLVTLIDNHEAAVSRATIMPHPVDRIREIQPHRIAIMAKFAKADEQDRDIQRKAIDKAVSAIHTQAIRFLTPMSYREHGFFRDVVREEIERVIGGSLQ